tara:strand:+ start:391 stop:693 length:303 start_codon:yes stop_codon:yes gene_type:complete
MRYTKGQRGPESTNKVSIQFLKRDGTDSNPMAKGVMNVHLKKGSRMVSLLAQGKNAAALLKAHAERGDNLTVTMRWTGREAATITGVVVNDDAQEAAAAA